MCARSSSCYRALRAAPVAPASTSTGPAPADRLLTETDGPFVELEGRSMRPRDVRQTVADLALLRGVSTEAMEHTVLANLRTILTEARG